MSNLSAFDLFKLEQIQIAQRATASISRGMLAAGNALFEATAGAPMPGTPNTLFFGHDHGIHGGTPLARGGAWTMETKAASPWSIVCTLAGIEYWKDRDGTTRAITGGRGPASFLLDVPDNINTAGTPTPTSITGGPVSLCAIVRVYCVNPGGLTQVEVFFRNRTTGTNSDRVVLSSFSSLEILYFVAIPVLGGTRNEVDLACVADASGATVDIIGAHIYATREQTQPGDPALNNILTASKP